MKNKKGFSLIELLVVVLIIGVLASFAVSHYRYAAAKAKFTQLLTATKAIRESQKRYMLYNGERSLDLSALDVQIEGCTYKAGPYSNSSMKDALSCPWGSCTITYDAARQEIACWLSSPYITYLLVFKTGQKYCCASKASGALGKKLCQEILPNATGHNNNDTCGSGATIYSGF